VETDNREERGETLPNNGVDAAVDCMNRSLDVELVFDVVVEVVELIEVEEDAATRLR
jgi:hypothetical protein